MIYQAPGQKKTKQINKNLHYLQKTSAVILDKFRNCIFGALPKHQNPIKKFQKYWQLKKNSLNFLFFLIVAVSASMLGFLGYKLITESDIFRVYTIKIDGNVDISENQILEIAGIERGTSLFALNPEDIKKRIIANEWIESVEVDRHFPASIEIKVHEYKPIALVLLKIGQKQSLYHVNPKGTIFASAATGKDIDFPVITGMISPEEIKMMKFGQNTQAAAALSFLRLAAKGNPILPIRAISEVNLAKDNTLILFLVDKPFPIYLDSRNIMNNYYNLVKVLRKLYNQKQIDNIKMIQLNYAENKALVTMIEKH